MGRGLLYIRDREIGGGGGGGMGLGLVEILFGDFF